MSIQHLVTKTWTGGGSGSASISKQVTLTGVEELNLDFSLAANTTNQQESLAFTKANLQSIFISSSVNITIKTNSSSAPQDTITITANDPYQWDVNCGLPNPFAGDVTTAYFTNGTAGAATVSVRMLSN